MVQNEDIIVFTEDDMLSFLKKMNDNGILQSYLDITNQDLENIFSLYRDVFDLEDPTPIQLEQAMLQYKRVLDALIQVEINLSQPNEEEVKKIKSFILSNHEEISYSEPTEEEVQAFIDILNSEKTTRNLYPTSDMNAFSYMWKHSITDSLTEQSRKEAEKQAYRKVKIGVSAVCLGIAFIHYANECYLNIIGDAGTLALLQTALYIKEHEEDSVKQNEKISYIAKLLMSCGLLSGLHNNQVGFSSFAMMGIYYVASKVYKYLASEEKERQKQKRK